jgi:hypothetical protein
VANWLYPNHRCSLDLFPSKISLLNITLFVNALVFLQNEHCVAMHIDQCSGQVITYQLVLVLYLFLKISYQLGICIGPFFKLFYQFGYGIRVEGWFSTGME